MPYFKKTDKRLEVMGNPLYKKSEKPLKGYVYGERVGRDTEPFNNGDFDHFYVLENGVYLATRIVGDEIFEISENEYKTEQWAL
ncbi:hypothetical protein [Campylobacter sp. RM9328]|uniref:hypothetical protein n=1 Tax=Campylobacter sp. RM9328 TaxID=1705720 RepID=UPI0014760DBF|nr:hypothetical protein [Campylobacter sp. RM9328]